MKDEEQMDAPIVLFKLGMVGDVVCKLMADKIIFDDNKKTVTISQSKEDIITVSILEKRK